MADQDFAADYPPNFLPDLAAWGIEEIEPGICEDSFDNRLILRENGARFFPVFSSTGELTPYIQVITPEMRAQALTQNKGAILSDPNDPDSDYLTDEALLLESEGNRTVPSWVLAATRRWVQIKETRETVDKRYRPSVSSGPGRCNATKNDGLRCMNWHGGLVDQGGYCKMHLANRPAELNGPTHVMAKARHRIQNATVAAVDTLEHLMLNSESDPVRRDAARDLLDRAGIRGGIEVDTKLDLTASAAELVADRLKKLAENLNKRQAMLTAPEPEEASESEELIAEVIEDDNRGSTTDPGPSTGTP